MYSDSLDLGCGYMSAFKGLELGVHVPLMSSSPNLVATAANANKLAAVPFSDEVTWISYCPSFSIKHCGYKTSYSYSSVT